MALQRTRESASLLSASSFAHTEAELAPSEMTSELRPFYLGAMTAIQASQHVQPLQLRLYYQIPVTNGIPYELPLFLVYVTSYKKVFHFPVVRRGTFWRVKYGDPAGHEFPSLIALVKHHINYSFVDPRTPLAASELFPVWRQPGERQCSN